MKALYVNTPLWESRPMSAIAGAPVFLKMEAFQPAGSFKSRGMGAACLRAWEAGAGRILSSSGGNAGYAIAYAGRQLGVPVTIVVPRTTSPRSRELILGEGAEVVEQGASWDDAHVFAVQLAGERRGAYIHPFDDAVVWAGHATMMAEVAETGFRPALVALSVGGGGLLCGVLEGMHDAGWADVPVLAVETDGTASFAGSVKAGRLVTLERIASIATTLGARTVTPRALEWTKQHEIIPWVVSDQAAVRACRRFADDHRVLVEPACGAALSVAYDRAQPLEGRGPVLIVVCGGAGVTRALLDGWEAATGAPQ